MPILRPSLPLTWAVLFSVGCSSGTMPPPASDESPAPRANPFATLASQPAERQLAQNVAAPRLVDRHAELGLDFTYDNGASGKALMVESTGGGGGWIDFDRDGWPDLFLVQGGDPLAETPHADGDRIVRSIEGRLFVDVTEYARPPDHGYGQGLAVGDFDNDGFEDLLITNVGNDVLWKNQGDGTFRDITEGAGTGDPRWGASAAWFDLDLDGDIDLLVVFQDRPAALLVNESDRGNWLQVECLGLRSNRRGIGAKVTVVQGAKTCTQQLTGGTSYCAAHEPLLAVGLGPSAEPCSVTVEWPGNAQPLTRPSVAANQRIQIREE